MSIFFLVGIIISLQVAHFVFENQERGKSYETEMVENKWIARGNGEKRP